MRGGADGGDGDPDDISELEGAVGTRRRWEGEARAAGSWRRGSNEGWFKYYCLLDLSKGE
jgi:hypothetical protein